MRILLINPIIPHCNMVADFAKNNNDALTALLSREADGPAFALNDIAGIIPQHEVNIFDMRSIHDKNPKANLEDLLRNLLLSFKPDIAGLTCMTAQVNYSREILEIIKSVNNEILTVIGGLHPTSSPGDFIHHKADIIVCGIGKMTFKLICDEFNKNRHNSDFTKITGIGINKNHKILFTPQLSKLSRKELIEIYDCGRSYPNRAITDKYDYRVNNGKKTIQYLNTSMGCTSRCNFCNLWKCYNGYYYFRTPDEIIEEITSMERYEVIRFCDLHTFGDIQKAEELFEKIAAHSFKHEYVADVRTDSVVKYPEVFKKAAKAGLKVVIIGLEATTDERLNKLEKNSSIKDTEIAMKILNDCGVWINGNYIVSCDFDERDFDNMSQFVINHPIFFSGFTILTPFPGTKQYDILKKDIINDNLDYYNLANAVLKTRLPVERFFSRVIELYKIGLDARKKYFKEYPEYRETKI